MSSLSEYKNIADNPLLVEIAKANDNELLNEVIREWTQVLKKRDEYVSSSAHKHGIDK